MPRRPDIDSAKWISSVREALGLTQNKFGELVDAGGSEGNPRDVVSKWESGTEPRFTYTRRIVTVAPIELARLFLGRSGKSDGLSDPDRSVAPPTNEGSTTMKREAVYIAERLNDIPDDALRAQAMEECSKAIRSVLHPHEQDADKRPDRALRSK